LFICRSKKGRDGEPKRKRETVTIESCGERKSERKNTKEGKRE